MGLDTATLVTVLFVVSTVLAGLLALTWAQNRSIPAFGVWALCFALCAAAAGMLAARDRLPGLLAVDIASGLRFLAFGLAWQAARLFTGQKGSWILALAPVGIWTACAALLFGDAMRPRILVASPLVATCAFALCFELWRASPRFRWIARPAAVLLAIHGAVFGARFLAAAVAAESHLEGGGIASPLHAFGILEMLVVAIALAFLLLSAAKEEIGMRHRQAALLDPLTGISNRRGFESEVARLLSQSARSGAPFSLVLFDLDHFKRINDSFGHQAGDRLLRMLAEAVAAELRPGDVLGRLGGDEFAIVLAGSRIEQALVLSERIRRAVEAMSVRHGDARIGSTVSMGVASLSGGESLDILFSRADAALYRAKARGRNRVVFAPERRSQPASTPPRREASPRRVA